MKFNTKTVENESIYSEIISLINRETQIQVYLQPINNIKLNSVFAYEALSRGAKNTSIEKVAPFKYSSTWGLDRSLDRICLETITKLQDNFPEGPLFINCLLSNIGYLYDLLKELNIKKKVNVEIDFTSELTDINKVLWEIQKIKSIGRVTFAIDDLGKYSIDFKLYDIILPEFIKVDISVTKGIHENTKNQKILDDIVNTAKKVGATIILEGIEDLEVANHIKEKGFIYTQGNFYQKPEIYSYFKK